MTYNFDNVPNRRDLLIWNKWTAYPSDVLPFWIADADFPVAPQIQAALHKQIGHGVLGYEMPARPFLEVIAARMAKLYNWEVDPDWIVYTAGVNNGYNIAARLLCSSRRGYLIQTPVYNEFLDTEQKTGAPQRVARLEKRTEGNRISYEVDFDAFEQEVKQSGMFLLCHPHNPIGKIFSSAELKRMAEICMGHNVTIVSDEIHSELLLGGARFIPLARLSREIEQHTITLISASKTFNVPGLACAFAIIPNEALRKRFYDIAYGMSFEISSPGLSAARVAFSGKADSWLRALRRYLTDNRDFVIEYVEENFPSVRVTKPDATYLIWLNFSQYDLRPSPYEFLLKEAKVALSDGGKFGKGNEQFVRLNFGTSRKFLKRGLDRIRKALRSVK
jgi:cystathionine beta-lyase